MMIRILAPGLDAAVERGFRALAERRLAAVALAVRLYYVEKGKWPGSLDELAPQYLPAVPDDPMASGKKIGYVADAQRPRNYSVGENETDEGGSDAPRKKTVGGGGRWTEEDAVVHLMRQKRQNLEENTKE